MARKIVSIQQHEQPIQIKEVASPSTPPAGYAYIYAKSDNKVYMMNDAGVETDLTATGPGGGATTSQAVIDFGTTGKTDEIFSVTDAAISPTSKITAFVTWITGLGRDPDEIMADPISIAVEPLAGSMNIHAMAQDGSVSGQYAINYQIG